MIEFNNTSNIQINNTTLITNTYEANNGNLSKVTYGNNDSINYTYDDLNRLSSVIKENNTYTNYYDNLNRISKLVSNDAIHLYEYDFASRLSTYRNSDNYETTYEYDKDNNVIEKSEELDKKYVYNYEYNSDNLLTKLTNNNSVFNYNYDLLGRLTNQNINDKYNTNYSYITHTYKTSTLIDKVDDNGTIYNYTYDKLGNITEIRKNNTLTNKYYYDEYSELIKEDDLVNNITKQYAYDNYGNILSKKTYEYNTTNLIKEDKYEYTNSNWQDLLTKFNNESITYDEIGNPLSIGNKKLTWMNGRELSSYSDVANNISYKYNLDGIRTSKIVNGLETKYYLEGRSIIFEDRNGDMLYYIYSGNELLGFVYNNKTYYYHKNMFGDIIGILDSNYNEIVTYEYDSWGALLNITDNSSINLGTINPFRYRSYYYDEETSLYYLNSRYYNPQVGRFLNADCILCSNEDITSYNLFNYVSNNPINFSDESGFGLLSALTNVVKKVATFVKKVVNEVKNLYKSSKTTDSNKDIAKANSGSSSNSNNSHQDLPRYSTPYDHKILPDGSKERWYDGTGKAFKDRHHTDHGNPGRHPVVPHDEYWGDVDGEWKLIPVWHYPTDDDIPTPPKIVNSSPDYETGVLIGVSLVAGYYIIKWGIAIVTAPATGGGSLFVAGATP